MNLSTSVVDSTGCFTENTYGSKLTLRFRGSSVSGTYSPPPSRGSAGAGTAIVIGKVEHGCIIRGEWNHVDGPLFNGTFEMAANREGEYVGWWKDGTHDAEVATAVSRQGWSWARAAGGELQPSVIGCALCDVIRFAEPPELQFHSTGSLNRAEDLVELQSPVDDYLSNSLGTAEPAEQPEFLSQVDRSTCLWIRDFFASRFRRYLTSVHQDRLTMFAAWLFFIQTVIQLVLELWGPTVQHPSLIFNKMWLNLVFNIVYTLFYLGFLVTYAFMENPPTPAYILGVAFFFLGYAAFAVIYAWAFFDNIKESAQWYSPIVYHEGAWAFQLGSILLTWATRPVESLFFGSLSFLLGSMVFAIDAVIHTPGLVSAGYTMFAFGRAFFVKGSETPLCNMRFNQNAATNSVAS